MGLTMLHVVTILRDGRVHRQCRAWLNHSEHAGEEGNDLLDPSRLLSGFRVYDMALGFRVYEMALGWLQTTAAANLKMQSRLRLHGSTVQDAMGLLQHEQMPDRMYSTKRSGRVQCLHVESCNSLAVDARSICDLCCVAGQM